MFRIANPNGAPPQGAPASGPPPDAPPHAEPDADDAKQELLAKLMQAQALIADVMSVLGGDQGDNDQDDQGPDPSSVLEALNGGQKQPS